MNKAYYYTLLKYVTEQLTPLHIETLSVMHDLGFNCNTAMKGSYLSKQLPNAYRGSYSCTVYKQLMAQGLITRKSKGLYLMTESGISLVKRFRFDLLCKYSVFLNKEKQR
jgi:hypothetical protein